MATVDTVHSHSYQHFEDLQLSSNDFYSLLEKLIKEYQYPDVVCTRQSQKEGGLLSSKREFLCITRKRHSFFVCASPFGKSFFISWWHQEDANTAANIAGKFFGTAVANRMEAKNYYQLDTELMFTQSITAIIKMAVEKVKADHGFREPASA